MAFAYFSVCIKWKRVGDKMQNVTLTINWNFVSAFPSLVRLAPSPYRKKVRFNKLIRDWFTKRSSKLATSCPAN